jgi:hypothetical protein
MAPAHFLRLKAVDFVMAGDGGMRVLVRRRQPAAWFKRLRQERRSLRACGQRGRSGGKSKSHFQKVAASHDISLLERVE